MVADPENGATEMDIMVPLHFPGEEGTGFRIYEGTNDSAAELRLHRHSRDVDGKSAAICAPFFAMFDQSKSVELRGTVKGFRWSNPQCLHPTSVRNARAATMKSGATEMTSPGASGASWMEASNAEAG